MGISIEWHFRINKKLRTKLRIQEKLSTNSLKKNDNI